MRVTLFISALLLSALTAQADIALGTWATEPDHKGQVAHVDARRCGAGICGKIVRTYDRDGNEIATKNIGKRLFWDMIPEAPGRYAGTGWVPSKDMTFKGKIVVHGDTMEVRGCVAMVCKKQTWTRVKASS